MSQNSDGDDEFGDSLDESFNRAANHIQKIHSQLDQSVLLELYALYKQVTCGQCNQSKPNLFNPQGRAKWSAWNRLGNLEKHEAMKLYIQKVTSIDPSWDDLSNTEKSSWVAVSVHKPEPESEILESEKTCFEHVKEKNLAKLKESLKPEDVNKLDDTGLGLIHWATDRNACEILEFLISCGADVNLQDCEGQTALHYASGCGHLECIRVLLKHGANLTVKDGDEQTCLDVAYDLNVRKVLEDFFLGRLD